MLLAAGSPLPDGGASSSPRPGSAGASEARSQCGELLWNQICRCLNNPERDEVKRILGAAAIDKNEDLHKELTALKRVLDDYREELEAKHRARVNSEDGGRHCASVCRRPKQVGGDGESLYRGKVGSGHHVKLPSSLGRRYLEDQIRLFVSNLPSLQTSSEALDGCGSANCLGDTGKIDQLGGLSGLRTPRERHLIQMIVKGPIRCNAKQDKFIDDDEERRRVNQQEKEQKDRKCQQIKTQKDASDPPCMAGSFSARPGTAPDLLSPEKDILSESSSLRPPSRESSASTVSAPDILQGFTPYLNVFDVEKVVIQLRAALQEESTTLLSQISSVQRTLEAMYTTAHREKEKDSELSAGEATTLEGDSTADPTIEELRELSSWLEQRCRLEDIFRKVSDSSKSGKTKVLPPPEG
eukprot:g1852.t1